MFCVTLIFIMKGTASAALTVAVNQDHINIGFFYHGSTVTVKGISDPGSDLIIKVTSSYGHQSLRKKEKVAGLVWLNGGALKFDHVPTLYSLHSTKKINDILSEVERDKYVIGYGSLGGTTLIQPVADKAEKTKWFNEFIKFKEDSKLYCNSFGDISVKTNGKEQDYYVLIPWPYQATPGEYIITVYAAKDQKVVETAESKVIVEQVGLVKAFAEMAKNSAVLYGIISIVVALVAGFVVGLIFRKGGGAH